MNRTQLHAMTDKFFRGKDGRWIITQPPNLIISIWIVLVIVSFVFKDAAFGDGLGLLRDSALFAWAYLEIVCGDSRFRRVLGLVVMLGLIVSYFYR